jgi:hypothetical protein
MPEIKVTKTVTRTEVTNVRVEADELEELLREHLNLPIGAEFSWRINRYEDFDGVEIVHKATEVESDA